MVRSVLDSAYGISVDEDDQRHHAIVSAKFLAQLLFPTQSRRLELDAIPDLHDYPHRYYGVAFTLPVYVLQKVLGLEDNSLPQWEFNHLCTFL